MFWAQPLCCCPWAALCIDLLDDAWVFESMCSWVFCYCVCIYVCIYIIFISSTAALSVLSVMLVCGWYFFRQLFMRQTETWVQIWKLMAPLIYVYGSIHFGFIVLGRCTGSRTGHKTLKHITDHRANSTMGYQGYKYHIERKSLI